MNDKNESLLVQGIMTLLIVACIAGCVVLASTVAKDSATGVAALVGVATTLLTVLARIWYITAAPYQQIQPTQPTDITERKDAGKVDLVCIWCGTVLFLGIAVIVLTLLQGCKTGATDPNTGKEFVAVPPGVECKDGVCSLAPAIWDLIKPTAKPTDTPKPAYVPRITPAPTATPSPAPSPAPVPKPPEK